MNTAELVVYNRAHKFIRVVYNPGRAALAEDAEVAERHAGHVLSPETPFGNLIHLRAVLGAARAWLWWYELHMPGKVLEVLWRELDGEKLSEVRLLSGSANVNGEVKADFERFRREMKTTRQIDVQWRILPRAEGQKRHDRFILSEDMSQNLPPLNSILMGTVGEILPSNIGPADFDGWWKLGTDLEALDLSYG